VVNYYYMPSKVSTGTIVVAGGVAELLHVGRQVPHVGSGFGIRWEHCVFGIWNMQSKFIGKICLP
jgi:hypothetical protein